MRRTFIIFFIFVIINLFNCDTKNGAEESKCCQNTTNKEIVVEFTSTVVEHEFIVHFKNYENSITRSKYIKSVLDNSEVSFKCFIHTSQPFQVHYQLIES